ncbi:hypothetical protein K470DRAFT_292706 [Piedraia hortae CBS 480.64]|uniref:Helicase ATP-binding domain-containing protein n=1 Tax=Piedraia hortae CBS 480.64 TaxID=1314780 RepID=A0A6A7C950_9PEZI|nr:hypothetical protein K470DRAFT_292706 [Piedraia hortae CBS 480.64]
MSQPGSAKELWKLSSEYKLQGHHTWGVGFLTRHWMVRNGTILADEENLDPPLQVTLFIGWLIDKIESEHPIILVVSKATLPLWGSLLEEKLDLDCCVVTYDGNEEMQQELLAQASSDCLPCDVFLTTHEVIMEDFPYFAPFEWKLLAVDEAHVMEDPTTPLYQALNSLNAMGRLLVTDGPTKFGVTGFASLVNFIKPGFVDVRPGKTPVTMDEINKVATPYILRRRRDSILTTEKVQSDQFRMELEKYYLDRYMIALGFQGQNVTHLRQLLAIPWKLLMLFRLLTILADRNIRPLIVCQHDSVVDLVKKILECCFGWVRRINAKATPEKKRQELEDFKDNIDGDGCCLLETREEDLSDDHLGVDAIILFDTVLSHVNTSPLLDHLAKSDTVDGVHIYRLISLEEAVIHGHVHDLMVKKLALLVKLMQIDLAKPCDEIFEQLTKSEVSETPSQRLHFVDINLEQHNMPRFLRHVVRQRSWIPSAPDSQRHRSWKRASQSPLRHVESCDDSDATEDIGQQQENVQPERAEQSRTRSTRVSSFSWRGMRARCLQNLGRRGMYDSV